MSVASHTLRAEAAWLSEAGPAAACTVSGAAAVLPTTVSSVLSSTVCRLDPAPEIPTPLAAVIWLGGAKESSTERVSSCATQSILVRTLDYRCMI